MKPCKCRNFPGLPESFGVHHHVLCPKYETEKNLFMFYYEDAVNGWIHVPDKVENIIDTDDMTDCDTIEIKFKCAEMTDEKFDKLPEID